MPRYQIEKWEGDRVTTKGEDINYQESRPLVYNRESEQGNSRKAINVFSNSTSYYIPIKIKENQT